MNATPRSTISPSDAERKERLRREYWCFISYRHADNKEPGRQWATWLHQALETYEVPADLVGTKNERGDVIPDRIFPVFRDEEELPADAELSNPIETALRHSRFLVVLCSPQAVQSRFVADEILRFKQLGKSDRILAAIIEGEPNASDDPTKGGAESECFPPPLRFAVDERGHLIPTRTEPIAANFRLADGTPGWTSPAAYREVLKAAGAPDQQIAVKVADYAKQQTLMLLKIVAGVLGVPLGVLTQRDKAYQLEKQKKGARTLRRWLMLVSGVGVAAGIAGFLAYQNGVEAAVQRDQAEAQRVEVTKQRDKQDELLWTASRADHEAATTALKSGRNAEGLAYLDRALGYRPMNAAALAASAAHSVGPDAPTWHPRSVAAFEGEVTCVAFSRDGRYLGAGSLDQTARVFEAATGAQVSQIKFAGEVHSVTFSADGRFLAAGSWDKTVRVIEATTGAAILRAEFGDEVNCVAFSPDGRYLAAGSLDKTARVLEVATGAEISRAEFGGRVNSVRFSPDGRCFAAGSYDRMARVIETASGREICRAEFGNRKSATSDEVTAISFSPDGRSIAAASRDHTVRVIDAATGREISLAEFGGEVDEVIFSPDGRSFAAASGDRTARVVDAATGKESSRTDLGGWATSVSFSPDARLLAIGSWDKTVRVIDAATGREISRTDFLGRVNAVSFSPDGRYLAAGGVDWTVHVMEAATGQEITRTEFGETLNSVTFSPDGRFLAAGSLDQSARVIEATTGREISRTVFGGEVLSVGFSSDGRLLVAGSRDGTVRVVESASGRELHKLPFGAEVTSVEFSPDDRHIAVGGWDKTARVIDAATGAEISKTEVGGMVWSVCFSPDGRYLAAGGYHRIARVVDAATGREISQAQFGGWVNSLSFSPDGRQFAAGSTDKTARVFEVATGREVCRTTFTEGVRAVKFSPDGRYLVAGGQDRIARVIEATTGAVVSQTLLGGEVNSLSFAPDGRYFAVATGDIRGGKGEVRVIETATGREIGKTEFGDMVNSVSFSPDGRRLAAGSADRTLRVIDCSWFNPNEARSSPWRAAQKLQSGFQFQADGKLGPVTINELLAAQRELADFVRVEPKPGERWQHAILKWSTRLPEERTTSPWIDDPLRAAVGRWLMQATLPRTIIDSANEAPWHPLVPAALARLEPKLADPAVGDARAATTLRSTFLARLTLQRLRTADEKLYGRETLAAYAAWTARIMYEELRLEAEALDAINFALERTPLERQQPFLDFRARLSATK